MAQLRIDEGDDLLLQLARMGETERIAPMMVDEALPILQSAMQASYAGKKISGKLKIVQAKKIANGGVLGEVTFKGKTGTYYRKGKGKYPLSNAGLAVFLEYGVKAHGNFPALPPGGYIQKAVAASKSAVEAKMQEVFDRETGAGKE